MNLRLLMCAFGRHRFGMPIPGVARIYCRCIECGAHSTGVEIGPRKYEQRYQGDAARRLTLLRGRFQQLRMRVLS